MEYISSPKEERCIFCSKSKDDNDRKNLILYRGNHCVVLMNLYPYNNGHLMISPYEHVSNPMELGENKLNEIMKISTKSMAVLSEKLKAEGFNFGANIGKAGGAGIEEHIHYHIVPRWTGDTNFMPVTGNAKVMVEGMLETYDKLKPGFDKI
jgi:ATP adenylyltransferase